MKKTKVLIVNDSLAFGGIETYIKGVCEVINKDRFQVTLYILTSRQDAALVDSIKDSGCRVVFARGEGKWQRLHGLISLIKEEDVDIVHFQLRYSYLIAAAKLLGRKIILHSHFSSWQNSKNPLKVAIMRIFMSLCCDLKLAPSQGAGVNAFYGHDFLIARNGIDTTRFLFSRERRAALRTKHNLKGKGVILQVGRLNWNKNQQFSIKIIDELRSLGGNHVLMLAGDGEGVDDVKALIDKLKLTKRVILLGKVPNIYDYYSAADIFLMPSFHEALPMSAIEAQISGLNCFLSSSITKETAIAKHTVFLDLDRPAAYWAKEIMEAKRAGRDKVAAKDSGYDLSSTVPDLEQQYERLISHE